MVSLWTATGRIWIRVLVAVMTCASLASGTRQVAASSLSIPYLPRFQGQPTQAEDCAPADVAMNVQSRGLRPGGLSDGDFITQVRNAINKLRTDVHCGGYRSSSLGKRGTRLAVPGRYGPAWGSCNSLKEKAGNTTSTVLTQ